MTLSTKILIGLVSILLLIGCGVIIYKQFQISAQQDSIEKQIVAQKQLADNITRSLAQYTTKEDLDKFAKDNNVSLDVIKKDLDKLNASLIAINQVKIISTPQIGNNLPSTHTQPGDNPAPKADLYPDPYGYQLKTQFFKLNEKFADFEIPFGEVGFSAWKENPWSLNIPARAYNATTVIGVDENQRHYTYNKFSVNINNKNYELKITSSVLKEEYPQPKLSWFNPRLYLGIDGGINLNQVKSEFSPALSLQIMSYGKFKNNPDLSILQIGAGYSINEKIMNVNLVPIMYNVGNHLPLMNNLYLGPSVDLNINGNVNLMMGLRVGL